MPVFFSSNLIFGRGVIGEIGPFITAFIRWAGSTLIMVPLLYLDWPAAWAFVRRHTWLWLWLGFLSIGICGGFVYWALTLTTASNATLIYTTSSLFIILFEWQFSGRRIGSRELLGMVVAFAGVAAIVLRGDFSALGHMNFNVGDLGMLVAAIAFAIYSILLRRPAAQAIRPLTLFGLIAFSGSPPAAAGRMGTSSRRATAEDGFGLVEDNRHHPVCLACRLLLLPAYGKDVRTGDGRNHALHDAAGLDHHGRCIPRRDFRNISRGRHRSGSWWGSSGDETPAKAY